MMLQTITELSKIDNGYKDKFCVLIHTCPSTNVEEHASVLRSQNINVEIVNHPDHSYMPKIWNAARRECKYSMKIDEDIFMSHYAFAFIIDSLDVLENDRNLMITPSLSTGIPSLEMFIDDVFTSSEKKEIYDIFKTVHMFGFLGANYEVLNLNLPEWNPDTFYTAVRNRVHHHFKGIHPLRISYKAQQKMLDVIKGKKDKITQKQDYRIDPRNITYICNSVFVIRNDTWLKILSDSTLYRDAFDEVPINLYKDHHDLKVCFVRNANALHPGYNTIVELHQLCDEMYNMLKEWGK